MSRTRSSETSGFGKAFPMFVGSREPFDMWFKALANPTGVDLNDPPAIELPALVSSYASD